MITGGQIKAARKLLGWSEIALSRKSQLSILWVIRTESEKLPREYANKYLSMIQAALEDAGVEFTDEQPGVRMRVEE